MRRRSALTTLASSGAGISPPALKRCARRVEHQSAFVPAAQHALGYGDDDRRFAPVAARPAQHDAAAEVGGRFAKQPGMMVDAGELARA